MAAALLAHHLNDPLSQHLSGDVVRLNNRQTVGEALATLREHRPQGPIIYCYVVDDDNKLRGVVPTRQLLISPLETPLSEIMNPRVVALPSDATVLDACEFFIQHRFLAFPVVDAEGHLLGKVDADLYRTEVTQLNEINDAQQREDLFQLIGVHLAQTHQTSPVAAFRSRFPWLLCNVGGGILAAFISGMYEHELDQLVQLALFIPVVLALAESVSIQSVSLALSNLHGSRPTWSALLRRLLRELQTGLMLGLATAAIVGTVALLWLRLWTLLFCLLGGIGGSVTAAAVIGLAMPNLLRLLRVEPQVSAGPIALAGADVVTLLLYFSLARWLLAA
jgi:magnesium transporter